MNALIEVRDLRVGYNEVPVVRDLNLKVAAGEVVALLGPNGAGKTTTLLALSGLIKPLSGEVTVLGQPSDTRRPYRMAKRGLAHVPEDRSLFSQLSVQENLALSARGENKGIDRIYELFPALGAIRSRRAGLLSGGEQQMLALGCALVTRPRVLLVDEMSLGLAPVIVENLFPVLRQVADEDGVAVLLVEQHVHLALTVCDRAYVLSHGTLVLEGTASELAARRDLLESSYLGESSIEENQDAPAG